MTSAMQGEFEEWWAEFPRKVGKLAAMKAYEKARKLASAKELREGVGRYIQHKPSYADFCHAKTWLTQGRWADEYDDPKPRAQPSARAVMGSDFDGYAEMAAYHAHRQKQQAS